MKLYLIRHGETVDNVAGLYAGVRDSALTNHGVEQARRLSEHLAKSGLKITHIFASPLSRAYKTAEAVHKAQLLPAAAEDRRPEKSLNIVKVSDLIEQDFGFYEGKPFYARSDAKKSGRKAHYDKHKDDPGFQDVESKESMGKRADGFLDHHLIPLIEEHGTHEVLVVAVVSHGMLLSHLWKKLLLRLPRKSLTIAPEVTAARDNLILEHLGGWSNTGYLELVLSKDAKHISAVHSASSPNPKSSSPTKLSPETSSPTEGLPKLPSAVAQAQAVALSIPAPPPAEAEAAEATQESVSSKSPGPVGSANTAKRTLLGWSTTILAVDSKQHLVGLKRQRGGIGRLAHDEGQKKLDEFFTKPQKTS